MLGCIQMMVLLKKEAVKMKAAYDKAGLDAEYHRFEGAGHGFQGEDAARSSDLAKAWFDRWLLEGSTDSGTAADEDERNDVEG